MAHIGLLSMGFNVYYILCLCYIRDYTLYTYVAKQVTSSGGLGQLMGVVRNRMRA